jgi:hypothetical protein
MPRGGSKPGERRGGRQKGTPNKTTAAVRTIIAGVVEDLGGREGLLAWVKENERNERAFWVQIVPRLIGTGREDDEPKTVGHYIIGDQPMTTEEWVKKFVKED